MAEFPLGSSYSVQNPRGGSKTLPACIPRTIRIFYNHVQLCKKTKEVDHNSMSNLGTPEIIIIALILVVLFGGKKIPEFIKGVGEAVKELKKSLKSGNSK